MDSYFKQHWLQLPHRGRHDLYHLHDLPDFHGRRARAVGDAQSLDQHGPQSYRSFHLFLHSKLVWRYF